MCTWIWLLFKYWQSWLLLLTFTPGWKEIFIWVPLGYSKKNFWPNWGDPNLDKNPFFLFFEGQIWPKNSFGQIGEIQIWPKITFFCFWRAKLSKKLLFHQCILLSTYLGNRCRGFTVVLLLRYLDLSNSFRVKNTKYWHFQVQNSTSIKISWRQDHTKIS